MRLADMRAQLEAEKRIVAVAADVATQEYIDAGKAVEIATQKKKELELVFSKSSARLSKIKRLIENLDTYENE